MPVDENTRLRIRQYLIELMDEAAADAMMESMPPIPWTELATKDDISRLGERIDDLGTSLGDRLDRTNERIDDSSASMGKRIDGVSERMDTMNERMGDLARVVTVGFFSMALTLAVFLIGTLASLFAAGAFN